MGLIDAKRTRLSAVLRNVGTAVTYVYDYGDDWEHELLLESILMPDPDAIYPLCIAGQRCCPPEDVGGIAGYADYLEAMADLHSKSKVSTPRKPIATLKPFVNRSQ